jgi:manganese transport protein
VVTLVPALVLLATGISPTWLLVLSQVVLSFGIAFALIPLVVATSDARLMGTGVNARPTRVAAWACAVVVVALNVALIWLTVTGS